MRACTQWGDPAPGARKVLKIFTVPHQEEPENEDAPGEKVAMKKEEEAEEEEAEHEGAMAVLPAKEDEEDQRQKRRRGGRSRSRHNQYWKRIAASSPR